MNSQAWKKSSSCTPETRSASAMNSSVVPVAYRFFAIQARAIRQ